MKTVRRALFDVGLTPKTALEKSEAFVYRPTVERLHSFKNDVTDCMPQIDQLDVLVR